jgi:hypothetical protein
MPNSGVKKGSRKNPKIQGFSKNVHVRIFTTCGYKGDLAHFLSILASLGKFRFLLKRSLLRPFLIFFAKKLKKNENSSKQTAFGIFSLFDKTQFPSAFFDFFWKNEKQRRKTKKKGEKRKQRRKTKNIILKNENQNLDKRKTRGPRNEKTRNTNEKRKTRNKNGKQKTRSEKRETKNEKRETRKRQNKVTKTKNEHRKTRRTRKRKTRNEKLQTNFRKAKTTTAKHEKSNKILPKCEKNKKNPPGKSVKIQKKSFCLFALFTLFTLFTLYNFLCCIAKN